MGAAVCWVGKKNLSKELMQSIACEINLSETCFIYESKSAFDTNSFFDLRWFTPTNEVPLCGHATLASAATLFYKGKNPNKSIAFETASGKLYAQRSGDMITLDFPRNDPEPLAADAYPQVIKHLFASNSTLTPSRVTDVQISHGAKKLVVRLDVSRDELESLSPDVSKMRAAHDGSVFKGVIVTTSGSDGDVASSKYDFLSRYFAPWNGIPEDPVTGSAHTVLGPYWSRILGGKRMMIARQCSKRGGDISVTLNGDERVDLSGLATIVVEGNLCVEED